MKIRKFRKQDAKKVEYLIKQAQLITLKGFYPKKILDFFCKRNTVSKIIEKSKEIDLFVGVEDDKILGISGLKENQVRKFYVNPRYQGKGVGRKLMDNLEKIAKKRKIKKLISHSTLYAEGFYKKLGFKRIKRITTNKNNIKFDEIVMEKRLK
ncbi:GNAT family N-acetyltransferase [Candidatus Woesearchaeota archaeon]|nr:GNAT family N-acetyltransferase [Candidatus Woesearchaeota archaeon]